MEHFDIIIAGGGPAGLTAAVYAARAGKSVLVLEQDHLGGQIAFAPLVENYPGLPRMRGADFADTLAEQAQSFGAVIEYEQVTGIRPGTPFTVLSDMAERTCSAVILATGARHRQLGLEGEEELVGCGVSYCALCDGAFYAGRHAAVVGGGNSAAQEALFLSGIILEDADGFEHTLAADALFVAVGHEAQSEPFAPLGICKENGFYSACESCLTDLPGVFAAGDGRDKQVRQLTTACADGANAATAACAWLDRAQ